MKNPFAHELDKPNEEKMKRKIYQFFNAREYEFKKPMANAYGKRVNINQLQTKNVLNQPIIKKPEHELEREIERVKKRNIFLFSYVLLDWAVA